MIDFRPSQVFLNAVPPLTATMGRVEAEVAAALLVRACQVEGDEWRTVSAARLGEILAADLAAERHPWVDLNRNPFCAPSFNDLIKSGFAEWIANGRHIRFTDAGLEKLRRWVRP